MKIENISDYCHGIITLCLILIMKQIPLSLLLTSDKQTLCRALMSKDEGPGMCCSGRNGDEFPVLISYQHPIIRQGTCVLIGALQCILPNNVFCNMISEV